MTETATAGCDNGTLDPEPGIEIPTITLAELIAGNRPMTVLQRVEHAALTLPPGSNGQIAAAKLYLSKTQPDLKAVEISGQVNHTHTTVDALEAARARAIQAARSGRTEH